MNDSVLDLNVRSIDQVEYMRFVCCCPVVQINVYEVVTSAAGFCRTIFCVASGCGCGRDRTPPSDTTTVVHILNGQQKGLSIRLVFLPGPCLPCFNCCMEPAVSLLANFKLSNMQQRCRDT
jgi:hypothetical protein